MTFDEWADLKQLGRGTNRSAAKLAWDHQQQRIQQLEISLDQAAAEYVWDALEINAEHDTELFDEEKRKVLAEWLSIHEPPEGEQ